MILFSRPRDDNDTFNIRPCEPNETVDSRTRDANYTVHHTPRDGNGASRSSPRDAAIAVHTHRNAISLALDSCPLFSPILVVPPPLPPHIYSHLHSHLHQHLHLRLHLHSHLQLHLRLHLQQHFSRFSYHLHLYITTPTSHLPSLAISSAHFYYFQPLSSLAPREHPGFYLVGAMRVRCVQIRVRIGSG